MSDATKDEGGAGGPTASDAPPALADLLRIAGPLMAQRLMVLKAIVRPEIAAFRAGLAAYLEAIIPGETGEGEEGGGDGG